MRDKVRSKTIQKKRTNKERLKMKYEEQKMTRKYIYANNSTSTWRWQHIIPSETSTLETPFILNPLSSTMHIKPDKRPDAALFVQTCKANAPLVNSVMVIEVSVSRLLFLLLISLLNALLSFSKVSLFNSASSSGIYLRAFSRILGTLHRFWDKLINPNQTKYLK